MARVRASLLSACVGAVLVLGAPPAYAAAPPTAVTSLATKAGSGQVTLTWVNPADADFGGVTVVWKDGAAPAAVDDGTAVDAGLAQSRVVTGLVNGTAYGFSVFTRNTDGELSTPVSATATPVPAVATTLAAAQSPGAVHYNRPTVITGTLRRADTSALVSGLTVDVYRRTFGLTTFSRVARVKTNAAGVATYKTGGLLKNTRWYLKHPGDPYFEATQTAGFTTLVRPLVAVGLWARTVEQNAPLTISTLVTPNHAGRAAVLQVKRDGAWRWVASRTLSATSRASFTLANATAGVRYYRVQVAAHTDHTTGRSATFGITTVLRTLRSGMSGADVLAAQQRLAALKYDVGSVNGYFGYDTTHATMAFQKVNGLRVTGTIDTATRNRLKSPVAPRLRYSHSGAWVEADLTKQTLYYARDGKIVRILDISSGNGELYTVDGQTQRATTPTGSFRIFHKIDGLRVSRLGSLWRPAYFASGGFAIHGSGFVPAYPDSHGCIRITNPAMNRLFSMLTIGMPVHVYR